METEEQEGEIPVSFEEFHNLKTKAKELQEVVIKRAAVGMAQVRLSLSPAVYCEVHVDVKSGTMNAIGSNICSYTLSVSALTTTIFV